jgi:RNA polymerase sigma factor (sigma-70 family)
MDLNEESEVFCMNQEDVLQELRRKEPEFLSAEEIALSFSPEDPARLYLKEISHWKVLCEMEEQDLIKQISQGDRAAWERLMEHNLLRVAAIVREYIDRGLLSLDLLQDGNEALKKAVDSYDPNSIYPFGAYASWQIRRTLARVLKDCTCLIRIPKEPVISPEPLDTDLLRNPAALRWIVERKMRKPMSEQDWMILAARFCPCGHRPLNLEELSAMMGIPRNEIREAELRTIRKNSPAARSQKIRDFYG